MPSVLVTGASRGIGKTIATHLAASGWDVIAGVRTEADGARLRAEDSRLTPVILDVTDENQIAALDQSLPQRLDAVVNNAGVAVGGPMETVPLGELRRQLDINVDRPDRGDAGCAAAVARLTRSSRVHFEPERQDRIPAVRFLLRIEIRDRGRGGFAADRTQAVGDSRFGRRTRSDRHRHVAHRRCHGGRHRRRDDRRRPPAVRQTPGGTEEVDPGVAEDRRAAGEGRAGCREGPHRAASPRALRRGAGARSCS